MTFQMKKVTQAVVCAAGLVGISGAAHAVNWLQLQGTEPSYSVARAKLWGFIQPEYQYTKNTPLKGGPFAGKNAVFNQQRPDLSSPSSFNVLRARIGVRGVVFPLDDRINYFFLAEFGNNGLTQPTGHAAQMSDASITLNYIPHARIRVGEFKYPGSEEGMMGIPAFHFVNFSQVTNQMMLERQFASTTGSGPLYNPQGVLLGAQDANLPNGPIGAFRDTGVQVFDWFDVGSWEHAYAVMVGNGSGTNLTDNNHNKDLYLYWSTAKIFGGKGPQRQSWKTYVWWQDGKRTIDVYGNKSTVATQQTFDRKRYGIGTTFRRGKIRADAEYMRGEGMIFNSTSGGAAPGQSGSVPPNAHLVSDFNILPNEKSNGWYIDGGYEVMPKLWLEARYDRYNRGTEVATDERDFKTTTIGVEYFFTKASRFIVNYEFRKADAPAFSSSAPANQVLDTFDNRFSTQLLVVF
ncbi:MAG: porin [Gammaproteobacteria bacterium]